MAEADTWAPMPAYSVFWAVSAWEFRASLAGDFCWYSVVGMPCMASASLPPYTSTV